MPLLPFVIYLTLPSSNINASLPNCRRFETRTDELRRDPVANSRTETAVSEENNPSRKKMVIKMPSDFSYFSCSSLAAFAPRNLRRCLDASYTTGERAS